MTSSLTANGKLCNKSGGDRPELSVMPFRSELQKTRHAWQHNTAVTFSAETIEEEKKIIEEMKGRMKKMGLVF